MRRLLPLALLAACAVPPPPAPVATPAPPPPPAPHGLTLEEEARVLRLEDRREFDAATADAWIHNTNALHRERMALALGRIGAQTFADTNGNGVRDAGEKQAGVDLLASLVHDPDPQVRTAAAFALGQAGDPAGADALAEFALDENAGVAAEAVEALSRLAPKIPLTRYVPFTAAGVREGVRARAVRFLFRFQSDEASAVAARLLESNSPVLRQEAAYALARRAYAPAREKLELLATDPETLTRAYVASALGRIGSAESVPRLMEMLLDAHPWVRTNALVALGRIAAKDPKAIERPQLAQDALIVVTRSDDPDPGTRAASIDVLGYYAAKNDKAKAKLLEIGATGSRWLRELAAGAIAKYLGDPSLVPQDLSNWAKVRVLEAQTNGMMWRKRFAADPDPMVRANAISNIPDDGVDAELALVRAALDDPDVVVRANAIDRYGHAKAKQRDVLLAAEQRGRGDAMDDARLAAITALADIDDPQREPFLRRLLTDADPVVRRNAADFIEQKLKQPRPQFTPLPVDRPPSDYAEIAEWSHHPHTATIHMTRGTIEIALVADSAPVTAWNFAQLAKRKFFDNTTFMRVVPNFVIQGGDPRNDMNGGPGYAIRDEINLQKYTRGALGMALSGPDTGGSQLFITHSPQPHLDGGYTIFGRVYEGMNGVVDQTERGDKVETITIDEHTAATRAQIDGGAKTPLPTEIGPTTPARLLAIVPEYAQRKADYAPDVSELEVMASSMKPGDRLEVFMGTWCPDSQREVPKLLKIADVLKEKYGKELPMTFFAVDRSKQLPADLVAGKSIEKVATFIYYRGDREVGRIVEKPAGLLEDDLLALAAKE